MNQRLLYHYNTELAHFRQASAEFARRHPKIAGRLALDPNGKEICPDPFVERLLEGVAFLTARIQLKFEAEFPRLSQSILETILPHYVAPTPSMLIARFEPELNDPALADGFLLPRGTTLRGELTRGVSTPCEYRTAHDVHLWPLEIKEASYLTLQLGQLGLPAGHKVKSALRLRFHLTAGLRAQALKLDTLPIYLHGSASEISHRLYEDIFAHLSAAFLQTGNRPSVKTALLPAPAIRPVGFSSREALLPPASRSFEGYRLLSEYYRMPERFLFFEVQGLRDILKRWDTETFDLILAFDEVDTSLENRVDHTAFELFCTPAINLFPKRLDRVQITDRFPEYHVVPDKTRPLDYEIHSLLSVEGVGETQGDTQPFTPFYFSYDRDLSAQAYYTLYRRQRALSERETLNGPVSKYLGSDAYLSLVDAQHAPFSPKLQQLSISALCSNRHLPLQMPIDTGRTDFNLDVNAPVLATRCITGPTPPGASVTEGEISWRVISHLSLNYLSLLNNEKEERGSAAGLEESGLAVSAVQGDRAAALREILALYAERSNESLRRQLQGLRSVSSEAVYRRVQTGGPIGFGRGLQISVECQEGEFTGAGVFLFGAVLEQFFSKYVSINSFTEMILLCERGLVKQWPAQPGRRPVL
jgi:type VI secretion system protein ImpG